MKINFLSIVALFLFTLTTATIHVNANTLQSTSIFAVDLDGDCDKCKDGKCDGKCTPKEGEKKCSDNCKKEGKCTKKSESEKKSNCSEKKSCGNKKGCGKH